MPFVCVAYAFHARRRMKFRASLGHFVNEMSEYRIPKSHVSQCVEASERVRERERERKRVKYSLSLRNKTLRALVSHNTKALIQDKDIEVIEVKRLILKKIS